MNLLISTGIYPPKIGGPAQYSKNLKDSLESMGHSVALSTFGLENYLPTGFRHLYFFLKVLPKVYKSDFVIIMDTFSVGLPTVLATKLLNKKSVIRTGGDFLWEGYIGRTGKKVFFRDFYNTESNNYSNKEIIIFKLSKWTMKNVSKMIFSTEWQRDIFIKAYDLEVENTGIIENYYGEKIESFKPTSKEFLASTRDLKWKNLDIVRKVFDSIKIEESEVVLFSANLSYEDFMQKMKSCYAVILLSLGDISPNMILDAIRFNKPFICTKEVGIFERIKDAGVFVDPLNEDEIKNAVLRLLDKDEYQRALERIKNFSFTHSWEEIAYEFLNISKNLK